MRSFIIVALLAAAGFLAGCGTCHDKTCTTTTTKTTIVQEICVDGTAPVDGRCPIPSTCQDGSLPPCTIPWACPDGSAPAENKCLIDPTCPAPYVVRDGECSYPYCDAGSQIAGCFCDLGAQVLTPANGLYYCCAEVQPRALLVGCLPPCPAGQVKNPCTNTCEVPK